MTKLYSTILLASTLLFSTAHAQWNQWGQVLDGAAADDGAGGCVSMPDVNTIAIGGYADSPNLGAENVRVFKHNGASWVQRGTNIESPPLMNSFGEAVSMPDANTVAVGATGIGVNSVIGQVRVYGWSGAEWAQKGAAIDGETTLERFGNSVSMPDANTVAIGAPFSLGGGLLRGRVQIYAWNGTAWVQKGPNIDGGATGDSNGWCVSMPDANTVAIGAMSNSTNGAQAGHVRVFDWDGSTWVKRGGDINGQLDEQFGFSVSMPDANTLAVGAPGFRGLLLPGEADPIPNDGLARVYAWDGSTWLQKGADIDDDAQDDNTGKSVSMPDANTVAVGTPNNASGGLAQGGFVRVYGWNGNSWVQTGADIFESNNQGNTTGWSISMPDAQTVGVGAPSADGANGTLFESGQVRIYSYGPTSIAASQDQDHPFRIHAGAGPGQYVVNLGGMQQDVRVTLLDALGRTISSTQLPNAERFDMMLPAAAGLYMVDIRTVNGPSATLKVVNAGQ